jgi:hypothetical protein
MKFAKMECRDEEEFQLSALMRFVSKSKQLQPAEDLERETRGIREIFLILPMRFV